MRRFGPKNRSEEEIFVIENLRSDLQQVIYSVMTEKGINYKDLADRLGCSQPHVSQLLSEDSNPTVETIGRIFFALGDEPKISSRFLEERSESDDNEWAKFKDEPSAYVESRINVQGAISVWHEFQHAGLLGAAPGKIRAPKRRNARTKNAGQSVKVVMQALQREYNRSDLDAVSINGNDTAKEDAKKFEIA